MDPRENARIESRRRLYPPITDPSWLVLRRRRKLFESWLGETGNSRLVVLDVGGRLQPYRDLLAGRLQRYVAIDLVVTPLVDVVANAGSIPFAGDTFDLCLCTQMLEYASDPAAVVAEIRRVLKPGGELLLSVPSLAPRDSEHDRWRFYPAAIRQLAAGFADVDIRAEGTSALGFFRTVNVGLQSLGRYPALRTLLRCTAGVLLNLAGWLMESAAGGSNDAFAVNYSVRARK